MGDVRSRIQIHPIKLPLLAAEHYGGKSNETMTKYILKRPLHIIISRCLLRFWMAEAGSLLIKPFGAIDRQWIGKKQWAIILGMKHR